MAEAATREPTSLRAGDTWKWRREDLVDYPAPAWTLKYRFKNATHGFELVANADGATHAVTVAAATTAGYPAGRYGWIAWVENSADERYTVDSGTLEVLPDLRAGIANAGLDTRSHARKVLEAIEAVLEGRASLDQQSYSIAGRTLARTPIPDLLLLRDRYRQEVAREEAIEALANGQWDRRRIGVRFNRV